MEISISMQSNENENENENVQYSPAVCVDYLNHSDTKEILQDIASTGTFRHEWDMLKKILSFQLKQVWSEYPEAKITSDSLGQSYSQFLNRLEQAISCFTEGPPFTLQRLCEILLDAKSIYPNLSNLALALEKNLLVTSTLKICCGSYPQITALEPDDNEKTSEKKQQPNSPGNGIVPLVADKDDLVSKM